METLHEVVRECMERFIPEIEKQKRQGMIDILEWVYNTTLPEETYTSTELVDMYLQIIKK